MISWLWLAFPSSAQDVIWSEDFSDYTENTGYEGSVNGPVTIGDYPQNVNRWTLDVTNTILSDADDYLKTREYMKRLQGRDLDGEAVWQSEMIDIASFSGVSFGLRASQSGAMTYADYVDVSYSIDGGEFILIPDWSGMGSTEHTLTGAFGTVIVTSEALTGSTLVIRVIMKNNGAWEIHSLDDIAVYPVMNYLSSTTFQNTTKVAPGKLNQQVIGIAIVTSGAGNPAAITSFVVNANGSSMPVDANIENARMYYTGTSGQFAPVSLFGTTIGFLSSDDFQIDGTQTLASGTNYFWLTFDTKASANIGDVIDAECVSIVIGGEVVYPDPYAPAGNRLIAGPLAGIYTIGTEGDYGTFGEASIDLMNLGIDCEITFLVHPGTYTEQIHFQEIVGVSDQNRITFKSFGGNPQEVILQYQPNSEVQNYVLQFEGTDHISIQDLTIQNSGTSDFGRVIFFKGICEHVQITGNIIIGRELSSSLSWPQRMANTVIGVGDGPEDAFNFGKISHNTIWNGSNAILLQGIYNSPLSETGAEIIENTITGFTCDGIHILYQDEPYVNKNLLQSKDLVSSPVTGIMLESCTDAFEISQNQIFSNSTEVNFGIQLWYCASGTENPGLTANNFIVCQESAILEGIGIMDCDKQNIFHNTIRVLSNPVKQSSPKSWGKSCINIDAYIPLPPQGIHLKNNLISNQAGTIPVITVDNNAASYQVLNADYNNFDYSGPFGQYGDVVCNALTEWQTASGQDVNSTTLDPQFSIDFNPLPGNIDMAQLVPNLSKIPRDLYDVIRTQPLTTPGAVQIPGSTQPVIYTWIGGNTDWFDQANWSPNGLPTRFAEVKVPAAPSITFPTIVEGQAECHNLNIEGSLAMGSGQLNVYGSVLNSGSFEQSGGTTQVEGTVNNWGTWNHQGGDAVYNSPVTNHNDWNLADGTASWQGSFQNEGDFSQSGGFSTIKDLTAKGTSFVQTNGEIIITDNLNQLNGLLNIQKLAIVGNNHSSVVLLSDNHQISELVVNKYDQEMVELYGDVYISYISMMKGFLEVQNRLNLNTGITVIGGKLVFSGTSENRIECNGSSDDGFQIVVNESGEISVQYTDFSNLGEAGIQVRPGAWIDPAMTFKGCRFNTNSPLSTIVTLDNSQDLIIEDAEFNGLTGDVYFNVRKTQDAGTVLIVNPSGNLSGTAFETDPFSRVKWSGGTQTQKIDIPAGWSGISSSLTPDNTELEVLFDPILLQFIIVQTMTGYYYPATNTNTIGNWPDKAAFQIKTNGAAALHITGTPYPDRTVELIQGWNILPVLSQDPVDIPVIIPPGKSSLVVIKEVAGNGLYWPAMDIHTLETLIPGKAYFIKVNEPITVQFPE